MFKEKSIKRKYACIHLLLQKKYSTLNRNNLHLQGNGEKKKLKYYITSCSFCLCNSACSLQSLDHVHHIVSESGDLQYEELKLISLTLVLLFATAQPLQTCLITPVHVKVPLPILTAVPMCAKPQDLNQPISS